MLRRTLLRLLIKSGYAAIDLLLISAAYFGLYLYRITYEFGLEFPWYKVFQADFWLNLTYFSSYWRLYIIVIVTSFFFLARYGLYAFGVRDSMPDELRKIAKAVIYSVLALASLSYLFKIQVFSRLVLFSFTIITIMSLAGWRFAKRMVLLSLIRKGHFKKNLIIVGAGRVGLMVAEELKNRTELGYNVAGFVDDGAGKLRKTFSGVKVLGLTKDLPDVIKDENINEILITIPSERELIERVISKCRRLDVEIRIIPEMFNLMTTAVEVGQLGPVPYMGIVKTPMQGMALVFKRLFDVIVTLMGIILISPVLLITALAVKIDSPGPVVFKQKRVGKNGELFDFYKFRSMLANAEELRAELAAANEADGPVFKIKEDPRVTRVGRFIRKYSIDELPQLFNVLKGDMSLVGPRPPLPSEVDEYGNTEWRRLEVIPGITGLWQVSGRSNISFNKWMELDIYYIENWSFWLDMKILLQTIPVVLLGKGAY